LIFDGRTGAHRVVKGGIHGGLVVLRN